MIVMPEDQDLYTRLVDALEASRGGAVTKPVSVTLPAPLAEALRLLVDAGRIGSVSEVAARALDEVLQAHVVALRLESLYADAPDAEPGEAAIEAMARRAGVE